LAGRRSGRRLIGGNSGRFKNSALGEPCEKRRGRFDQAAGSMPKQRWELASSPEKKGPWHANGAGEEEIS